MSAKPKVVLITGCSEGGIGYSLAKEYHAKGLRVFATARHLSSMQGLPNLGIECLELDVTDLDSIIRVRDIVCPLTGGYLHILVNNAGQSYSLPFTDCEMRQVRAMFETNVFDPMTMIQQFIPLLIASGSGLIVNIGSVVATVPLPFGATYSAAKGALHSFGNTLRVELAPFNVKVTTVVTGGVKSNVSAPQHRQSLPSDSLYLPMKEEFLSKRQGNSQSAFDSSLSKYVLILAVTEKAMATDAYARSIVASTIKPSPKTPFGPADFNMMRRFGLDKFKRLIDSQKEGNFLK